ncbi:MAG TPA: hypothetical protein EYO18_08470, partial [Candidatus Marinimicrobia bacterium]|nr:hypothetical protein [Candidatus Neomarinimicrobiota bacterium]
MTRFIVLILFILSPGISKEVKIRQISLSGLITNPKQEISGMDWYKDNLFLLPENLGGFLFMMKNAFPVQPRTWDIPGEGDAENPLSLEA